MSLTGKEDQSPLVSQEEIALVASSKCQSDKELLIQRIIKSLGEKRDAYFCIVESLVTIVNSQDHDLRDMLKSRLIDCLVCWPKRFAGKIFLEKVLLRFMVACPEYIQDLFEQLIDDSDKWEPNFRDQSEVLRVKIVALKAIRKAEQTIGGRESRLKKSDIDHLCYEAILSCCDSTKVDTLALLLEARSSTKPLGNMELDLFKIIYKASLNFHQPGTRQVFLGLTGKMLKRMPDSLTQASKWQINIDDLSKRYIVFLEWLIDFSFDSIYCNAYFGSFVLTISTLKLVIKHITFDNQLLPITRSFSHRKCFDSVISCLNDSFEDNKALALDLLLMLPHNENIINEGSLKSIEMIAYQLVASVNPAHSLTCHYVFKLLIGLRSREPFGQKSERNEVIRSHLIRLVEVVEKGILDIETNFLSSLKKNALYPKLTCIRALLSELDIQMIEDNPSEWTLLAVRIINCSKNACRVLSSIICNLNPETIGHLPMDLKQLDVNTLAEALNVSVNLADDGIQTISSQMLLISGWKTVKESSLTLGLICQIFWWPEKVRLSKKHKYPGLSAKAILSFEHMKDIIGFFDHYLRNIRHRGAFEQAYTGFLMITRRVWHEQQLQKLLKAMLEDIMGDFEAEAVKEDRREYLKAFVTRRSAGLPFICQAIISSEHKHESQVLRWVMGKLFSVLNSERSEEYQRIHCLNILRGLIKEHLIGEKVLSYVGQSFEVTLDSFHSESFPIRNCANMLLKSCVDRCFGINRTREYVHRKNQLSFEKFFSQCPRLHAKMIQILESSLVDRRYLSSARAVIIILARLKPSLDPSTEYQPDVIIKPLCEHLLRLALECPDLELRKSSARLAVRLSYPSNHLQVLLTKVRSILDHHQDSSIDNANTTHGALLLLKELIEINFHDADLAPSPTSVTIAQYAIPKFIASSGPFVFKTIVLDIAESCCQAVPQVASDVISILRKTPLDLVVKSKHDPFRDIFYFKYITFLLLPYTEQPPGQFKLSLDLRELSSLLMDPESGYSNLLRASILRYLRELLTQEETFVDTLLDKLDLDMTALYETPLDQVKSMSCTEIKFNQLERYCSALKLQTQRKSVHLVNLNLFRFGGLLGFPEDPTGCIDMADCNCPFTIEILAMACKFWDELQLSSHSRWPGAENSREQLDYLTKFIRNLPDCDIKSLSLLFAGHLLKQVMSSYSKDTGTVHSIAEFTKLLDSMSDGDQSLAIRETCVEISKMNVELLLSREEKHSLEASMNLLSSLIKLSHDEDSEVRMGTEKVIRSLKIQLAIADDDGSLSSYDFLIQLITNNLFDPENNDDFNKCFKLLMRIIFNHSRNYSTETNDEERNHLFDKTKLNTYADHVATIQSALKGLTSFAIRRSSPIDLNELELPSEVCDVIFITDKSETIDDQVANTGDYRSGYSIKMPPGPQKRANLTTGEDNNQIISEYLRFVMDNLDYFSGGYSNVLTDTGYTYQELCLYKRIAFIKFITQHTKHQLLNKSVADDIRLKLYNIVNISNSTTILIKSLKLAQSA